MPLVLFILGLCIVLSLLVFLLLWSTIRIQVKDLEIGNLNKKEQSHYTIGIEFYFLDKFKFLKKEITARQIRKNHWIKKLEDIPWKTLEKEEQLSIKEGISLLKDLKMKITKFVLRVDIGTEDAILTSYLVAFIASMIGILLPHVVEEAYFSKCTYIINPIYRDQNCYHIALDSIIRVKIVHIIYIIYILIQKGSKKNERTSNRRSYDHGNELYSRND